MALETSISDNQDISWCEEASQKQPDSKRLVINMLNIAHVRLFVFSFGDVELVSNECAEMNLIGNENKRDEKHMEVNMTLTNVSKA